MACTVGRFEIVCQRRYGLYTLCLYDREGLRALDVIAGSLVCTLPHQVKVGTLHNLS